MDDVEDFRTMKMKCNLANAIKESRNNEGVGERERETLIASVVDRTEYHFAGRTVQYSAVQSLDTVMGI